MYNNEFMPTEDEEQMAFVQWLDTQHIPYWHTNNEMWTKSWKQKTRSKAMGTQSGIPDLFLVFKNKIIGIEMKRQKRGVVSDNQKRWHKILGLGGVPCYVAHGCGEAIMLTRGLISQKEVEKIPLAELDAIEEEFALIEQEKQLKRLKRAQNPAKSSKKPKKPVEF